MRAARPEPAPRLARLAEPHAPRRSRWEGLPAMFAGLVAPAGLVISAFELFAPCAVRGRA